MPVFGDLAHRSGFHVLMHLLGFELVRVLIRVIHHGFPSHRPKETIYELWMLEAVWTSRENSYSSHLGRLSSDRLSVIELTDAANVKRVARVHRYKAHLAHSRLKREIVADRYSDERHTRYYPASPNDLSALLKHYQERLHILFFLL